MDVEKRIMAAWQGRISGCLLGKPVEGMLMREGKDFMENYLKEANSYPVRDYINYVENPHIRGVNIKCCKGRIDKAEQDDDITYLVLALMTVSYTHLTLPTILLV